MSHYEDQIERELEANKIARGQVGGSHYQGGIQPVEYIKANDLGFLEGNAVKYITRWKKKGGVEDLRKAQHYISMLIQQEL